MGAAMIKPASDLVAFKVSGGNIRTVEIEESDLAACAVFLRYTPRGIVLVKSYFEIGETLVFTVIEGREYTRWYEHGLISARAATLLVNRFFSDIDAAKEGQPCATNCQ